MTSALTDFALWRDRAGLELSDVANEFNEPLYRVRLWEEGQAEPPEPILRTLSVLADFSSQQHSSAVEAERTVSVFEGGGQPVSRPTAKARKSQLGQFMTPPGVAEFMAGLFHPFCKSARLLDAGAGEAALTKAFVDRWRRASGSDGLVVHAYEFDDVIIPKLRTALERLSGPDVETQLVAGDFIADVATALRLDRAPRYTHAILNPPYKKIGTASTHRAFLRTAGLETVNLYSGFVGLSLELLETGGELVAIIPRSFCNGPYYQPFRRFLLKRAAILQMHLFEARDQAFKGDGVLQENVIIHLQRGAPQQDVIVSTSRDDRFSDYDSQPHPFERIVFPDDGQRFIHIPTGEENELLGSSVFRHSLSDIGIDVSTGPVVDFRLRAELRKDPEPGTVPLLYPGHFSDGRLNWPKPGFKKSNAIVRRRETEKWLYPSGFYAVVRRFSSKEERRRIVANVVEPDRAPGSMIGFENHLNIFHSSRGPLPEALARGLALYLNATSVDRHFRRFNGHTQVNATDLRTMRYPSREGLETLGRWAAAVDRPSQEVIDEQVGRLG